ncbi:cysteine-rich motor neuron 1 protein-like isoform X1 [Paramisgurnus dabryanus]|uniref:cysteine-rich motor neuron 1 protein-like isoform X1 n=1 Tax=Paramisgurnus dabryanus TaxID=90735 RepID=UPI0031F38A8F
MFICFYIKSLLWVLTLLEFCVRAIEAHECAPCSLRSCPRVSPFGCDSGRVLARDPCGCCDQCSRLELELCGGVDWTLGYCGSGLTCTALNGTGPVLIPAAGVCKVVPDGTDADLEDVGCSLVSGCDRVNDECVCESKHSCIRTFSYPNRDSCVHAGRTGSHRHEHKHKEKFVGPVNGTCVFSGCNLTAQGCVCSSQSCYDHFTYNNRNQCQQAAEKLKCADISCPPLSTPECPSDSVLTHLYTPPDECCPTLPAQCTCAPCPPPPDCSGAYRVVELTQPNGAPGNCCHTYTCQRVSSRCVYNGHEYSEGDVYRTDPCWVCQCRGGISFCSKAECAELDCENFYVPEGECCPVCTDVELLSVESTKASCWLNHRLRAHEEQWKEDDCTFCQCVDGEPHCTAMACKLSCQNPVKIAGECCPFCEEPSYETVSPAICPRLKNCSLSGHDCPLGFQRDRSGCLLCQCVSDESCPVLSSSCSLDCLTGYEKDGNGCDLCECKTSTVKCRPLTCSKICPHGFVRNKHGCEMCRCVKCPPFTCDRHCTNGYKTNRKGCSLCECKDIEKPEPSVCVTADGRRFKEGDSWHDGCRECYCNGGREMCLLISCPVPTCAHPVLRSDHCCPSCDADESGSGQPDGSDMVVCRAPGGELYVEGETWSLDECMRCTCRHGRVLCDSEVCPPLLCHQPIKIKDSCCHVCPEDELNPLLPVNGSQQEYCVSTNGEILLAGDLWRSNACSSCTCRNGTIECFHQRCPPAQCRVPVLRKGQCCPQCLEVTTTSVPVVLSTTSAKPKVTESLNTSTQTSVFTVADPSVKGPTQVEMNLIYQSAAWILAAVLLVVVMFLTVSVLINRRRDWFQMSCYNAPRKTVILKKHISKNSVVHMDPSRENQFNSMKIDFPLDSGDRITIPRAKLSNGHAEVQR